MESEGRCACHDYRAGGYRYSLRDLSFNEKTRQGREISFLLRRLSLHCTRGTFSVRRYALSEHRRRGDEPRRLRLRRRSCGRGVCRRCLRVFFPAYDHAGRRGRIAAADQLLLGKRRAEKCLHDSPLCLCYGNFYRICTGRRHHAFAL